VEWLVVGRLGTGQVEFNKIYIVQLQCTYTSNSIVNTVLPNWANTNKYHFESPYVLIVVAR
jgi:hypothetical protein